MLDRLVESKNHGEENKKLNGLLATTFSLAAIGLALAFVFSLFSFELNLGDGDLELSSLVAPNIIEETTPDPQPIEKQKTSETVKTEMTTRVENIQRLDESPVKPPDTISVTPSKNQARPKTTFTIGNKDLTLTSATSVNNVRETNGTEKVSGVSDNKTTLVEKDEKEVAIIKKPVKPTETKPDKPVRMVSRGVVNGTAKYLAQPIYPAAARAVRAGGRVEVQVVIDETGRVISASVVNGNTLLRESALNAARKSTFTPTKLSDEPVKVSGVIVYNFNP